MEIDEAIQKSSDRRLKAKYKSAVYVIQRAFALYELEHVAFSFNGGKDSTVLLHLLRAGYCLFKGQTGNSAHHQTNITLKCPIRTIYFESASAFLEINSFTYETVHNYDLQLDIIRTDFKSGLEALLKEKPVKAIFLGTRIGDPNAVGQEQFSPSSVGWPPFMRVNPILDWSYRDVWAFISTCAVKYCTLYDQGYTSIGSIYDTVPNPQLCVADSSGSQGKFKPAYLLLDGRLERAGRARKSSLVCHDQSVSSNGLTSPKAHLCSTLTASIVAVGDEILFGKVKDEIGALLCKKLYDIGWLVAHMAVVRNDIESVAEEVEIRVSTNDMVFLYGGVGPLPSDVSLAAVAKAFGTRLAPDEEFDEFLRNIMGDDVFYTGDLNEMARLPEGITELLHHEMLQVPLIKCKNVIILSAANVDELEKQWACLRSMSSTPLVHMPPFKSKYLSTTLSDVEISQTLSKINLEFSDVYIGFIRQSLIGPFTISFVGKDQIRVDMAALKLVQNFPEGAFSEK